MICYVRHKWCILSALFTVPLVDVCGQGDCQFKNVKFFLCRVNDDDIWLEICHAKFHWDGPSSCGFPAWQITVHFLIWFHIGHNEIDEIIVSPCVTVCVKHHFATVQVVIGCSTVSTQFAFIR